MTIRSATGLDLQAIFAVDDVAHRDSTRKQILERHVCEGRCWLSEFHGRVIGFVVLDYSFYGNGFIPLLVVHSEFRRRGVARALLRHAIATCSTLKLFTSTNESNAPMRSLLGHEGFEASGVIDNLNEGDPELVFVRRVRA